MSTPLLRRSFQAPIPTSRTPAPANHNPARPYFYTTKDTKITKDFKDCCWAWAGTDSYQRVVSVVLFVLRVVCGCIVDLGFDKLPA